MEWEKQLPTICVLIGLVGAIGNNGKKETTDLMIQQAILDVDSETSVELLREEKNRIAPDCQMCKNPCGNTSDYDIKQLQKEFETDYKYKRSIWEKVVYNVKQQQAVSEQIYQAIAYIGYDLSEEAYQKLLSELE